MRCRLTAILSLGPKWLLAGLLFCGLGAMFSTAEQLRILIDKPEVTANTNALRSARLWQSLLGQELSKQPFFALLEREDLPALLQEWERTALQRNSSTPRPAWLSADCIVISKWQLNQTTNEVIIRVLNADLGGIEKELVQSFTSAEMEEEVSKLARELQSLGLKILAQRNIHTVLSILDYENQSPLPRNKWLEKAMARRLFGVFQKEPGVLVLERENVDQLFQEKRLRRGGFSEPSSKPENRWQHLRHYFVVSGTFDETQPEGEPLSFRTRTLLRNLEAGENSAFSENFVAADSSTGMLRIAQRVRQLVLRPSRKQPDANPPTNSAAEALVLANKAVRLIQSREPLTIKDMSRFAWELMPHWFSPAYYPFDQSEERRANVVQAVQYLKAALLLDEKDPVVKVFLSSLLTDRQVQDLPLALELAEEVGCQSPEFQARAWLFLCRNTTGEKSRYYRELLLARYSGSYQAKTAADLAMLEILEQHRGDADVTAALALFRPYLEKAMTWSRGDMIEAAIWHLFELTQLTGRNPQNRQYGYELRDPANRARGERLLEEMLQKYPNLAFYSAYFWSYYWEQKTDQHEIIYAWIRRASDLALKTDRDPWVIGVRIDPYRIKLARHLMAQGKYQEAAAILELIANYHSVKGAGLLLGECAYGRGDYRGALERFQSFGPDHKEAVAWVRKCQDKLGLPAEPAPARAYTRVTATPRWQPCPFKLPPGRITAMAQDGDSIWLGLSDPALWSDHNYFWLENNPPVKTTALATGGVVRYHRLTGKVTYFTTSNGLSLPWVTSLAIADGRVWVGTMGKGIDVFDLGSGKWNNVSEGDGLPSNFIRCLDADQDHLWVGTGRPAVEARFTAGGVAGYDFRAGQWRGYLPSDYPATNSPPTTLVKCLKSIAGTVWCGLDNAIYSYDIKTNRWRRFPNNYHLTSIACLADRVWFAGDQYDPLTPDCGIVHCNLKGEDWRILRGKDGLPDLSIKTLAINGNQLVLGTYGLMLLDPVEKQFLTFHLRSDVAISVSSLLALENEIWVGNQTDNTLRILELR